MDACPQMSCELVFQTKEEYILSYHVHKRSKEFKKIYFWYVKGQVSQLSYTNNLNFLGFFEKIGSVDTKPKKSVQIFLQTLIPVSNTKNLEPEMVVDQN